MLNKMDDVAHPSRSLRTGIQSSTRNSVFSWIPSKVLLIFGPIPAFSKIRHKASLLTLGYALVMSRIVATGSLSFLSVTVFLVSSWIFNGLGSSFHDCLLYSMCSPLPGMPLCFPVLSGSSPISFHFLYSSLFSTCIDLFSFCLKFRFSL